MSRDEEWWRVDYIVSMRQRSRCGCGELGELVVRMTRVGSLHPATHQNVNLAPNCNIV
jgi:hypothetical protein